MIVARCVHWGTAANETPLLAEPNAVDMRGPGYLVRNCDLLILLCTPCQARGEAPVRFYRRPEFA